MLCFQRSLNKGAQTLARRQFGGLSLGPIDIFADYEFGVGMIEDKLRAKPLVSVIVVDYNGHRFWSELLEALREQSFRDFELIVVENGEPLDGVLEVGEIEILRVQGHGNVGFAAGVNLGASVARGPFVAFLNNDAVPEPQWLENLVQCLVEDPTIALACSKVLFYDRYLEVNIKTPIFSPSVVEGSRDERWLGVMVKLPGSIVTRVARINCHSVEVVEGCDWVWTKQSARLLFPCPESECLEFTIRSHPSQRGEFAEFSIGEDCYRFELLGEQQTVRISVSPSASFDVVNSLGSEFTSDWSLVQRGLYEKDENVSDAQEDIEMGSACAALVRRSAVDGEFFDPEFFAYFEDSDLCIRVRREGWKLVFVPNSVVRHHGSATSKTRSPFQVFYSVRNRSWLLAKFAPPAVVLRFVFRDFWNIDRYERYLDDHYSLSRLRKEIWVGCLKRLWMRFWDFY